MDDHSLVMNTSFWYALAFVAFFVLAGRAVFRAITGWLDGKITKIKTDIEEATRLRNEAEDLLQQAKARHASATKEAEALIAGATAEATAARARLEEETARILKRREDQVAERLALAEQQALADIQRAAAAMALQQAEAMLKEKLTGDVQAKLADAAIKDIGKAA